MAQWDLYAEWCKPLILENAPARVINEQTREKSEIENAPAAELPPAVEHHLIDQSVDRA